MKPINYYQTDSRWKDIDYSTKGESTTIGKSGCGPTCMAMVIASLVQPDFTPVDACKWALENGYKALNQGTYYSYFVPQGYKFGIEVRRLNTTNLRSKAQPEVHEKARQELLNGNWLIACMGTGNWTSGGHYILPYQIYGDDVLINDPASSKATRVKNKWKLLTEEVKYYWVIEVPKEGDDEEMSYEVWKSYKEKYEREKFAEEPSEWSSNAREWAEDNGIIKGDAEGNKGYKANCTREQLVTILHRLQK